MLERINEAERRAREAEARARQAVADVAQPGQAAAAPPPQPLPRPRLPRRRSRPSCRSRRLPRRPLHRLPSPSPSRLPPPLTQPATMPRRTSPTSRSPAIRDPTPLPAASCPDRPPTTGSEGHVAPDFENEGASERVGSGPVGFDEDDEDDAIDLSAPLTASSSSGHPRQEEDEDDEDDAIDLSAPLASGSVPEAPPGEEPLSLNEATFEELRERGMSVTQTGRVLAHRERAGGFKSIDELDDISGFPRDFLDRIKPRLKA